MTEPVLCPPHTWFVDVLDHLVVHVRDCSPCDAAVLVRGSSVLTPAQIRAERSEEGATP